MRPKRAMPMKVCAWYCLQITNQRKCRSQEIIARLSNVCCNCANELHKRLMRS
jgi:hypothetical protein